MPVYTKRYLCPLLLSLLAACSSVPLENRPSVLYKEGEAFYASRRYDDAIAQWKRVREAYASPELSTNSELKIADAYFESERYIEATAAYDEFRKLHPTHEKSAYALYRMGLASYNQITGIDTDQTPQKNAVIYFEEFLRKYPASEYAADVRDKLETTMQQQLQHEQYVARFYYRTEKYDAAIKRLEEALVTYPKSPLHDETWYLLGAARLRNGNQEKAKEAFNRLSTDFPGSKYIMEASKLLEKYY
jgi:outer membrane protein assembly factor BamD